MKPMKLVEGYYQSCEPDDPRVLWSVFSCDQNGISRFIANATTREKALKFIDLLERAASELEDAIKGKLQSQGAQR